MKNEFTSQKSNTIEFNLTPNKEILKQIDLSDEKEKAFLRVFLREIFQQGQIFNYSKNVNEEALKLKTFEISNKYLKAFCLICPVIFFNRYFFKKNNGIILSALKTGGLTYLMTTLTNQMIEKEDEARKNYRIKLLNEEDGLELSDYLNFSEEFNKHL